MIRVKLLSRRDPGSWKHYFPHGDGRWGRCQFLFAPEAIDYDWLVVLDDLPEGPGQGRHTALERLHCPRHQTLLVTTEPESIKTYGRAYCAQFGHVLTSQPAWALPHPSRHDGHTGNHWFYGDRQGCFIEREHLLTGPDPDQKSDSVSVVHSPKRMRHTRHRQRYAFVEALRRTLPELVVFGRNAQPLDDKADALDPVRYHLALENHLGPNHVTEKLTDAFLGRCLPFYAGAPNASEVFPEQAFVPISMDDPEEAATIIREAIASGLWQKRLPAIEEARRRVLEKEHLFALIERCIEGCTAHPSGREPASVLLGRHAWRRKHPFQAMSLPWEKLRNRLRTTLSVHQP